MDGPFNLTVGASFALHLAPSLYSSLGSIAASSSHSQVKYLAQHISIQWITFIIGLYPLLGVTGLKIATGWWGRIPLCSSQSPARCPCSPPSPPAVNAAVHAVIDWNIWRGYKFYTRRMILAGRRPHLLTVKRIPKDKDPMSVYMFQEDDNFYITIGFDQLLHALTILACLYYYRV